MKASIEWIHSAFPDAQVTIEDQVAEGDKVVSRFTVSGTHRGEIMGAAPTGNARWWMPSYRKLMSALRRECPMPRPAT